MRMRLASDRGANYVKYLEEIRNTSDRPIYFEIRDYHRRLFSLASYRMVDGIRRLVYRPKPVDITWGEP